MKTIASGRLAQTAARYGEHAPGAAVCCNACRTCVTTNVVGIVLAAVAGAGGLLTSRRRRRASG